MCAVFSQHVAGSWHDVHDNCIAVVSVVICTLLVEGESAFGVVTNWALHGSPPKIRRRVGVVVFVEFLHGNNKYVTFTRSP